MLLKIHFIYYRSISFSYLRLFPSILSCCLLYTNRLQSAQHTLRIAKFNKLFALPSVLSGCNSESLLPPTNTGDQAHLHPYSYLYKTYCVGRT